MAGLRVHFVFPAGLVERVDAALTVGQSRGEFVRAAVEQKLSAREDQERWARTADGRRPDPRAAVEQALGGRPGASVSPGVQLPAPAPAEQPPTAEWPPRSYDYRHSPGPARSSVQAKRDVRPVPKAKP